MGGGTQRRYEIGGSAKIGTELYVYTHTVPCFATDDEILAGSVAGFQKVVGQIAAMPGTLPFSGIAASQTATMTADLAVRFLAGEVTASSRVSWQGSDVEAGRMSLATTYRYRRFKESLKLLPLQDANCGVCDG